MLMCSKIGMQLRTCLCCVLFCFILWLRTLQVTMWRSKERNYLRKVKLNFRQNSWCPTNIKNRLATSRTHAIARFIRCPVPYRVYSGHFKFQEPSWAGLCTEGHLSLRWLFGTTNSSVALTTTGVINCRQNNIHLPYLEVCNPSFIFLVAPDSYVWFSSDIFLDWLPRNCIRVVPCKMFRCSSGSDR